MIVVDRREPALAGYLLEVWLGSEGGPTTISWSLLPTLRHIPILISLDVEAVEMGHASESTEHALAKIRVLEEGITGVLANQGRIANDARAFWELNASQSSAIEMAGTRLTGNRTWM